MTEFEYLAVIVSVVVGLGVTHLLAGIGRTIHRRKDEQLDTIHVLWTAATFVILVLNWWVFFESRTMTRWSFGVFLVVVGWAVLYYLMAVILYPPDLQSGEYYGQVFEGNRNWFLSLLMASLVADIGLTAIRGDLWSPPQYLPAVLHVVALSAIGLVVRTRRYHLFLAGYVLVFSLSWSLVVRRFLS